MRRTGLEAFKHIDGDLKSYQHLLERLLQPDDAFDLQGEEKGYEDMRRLRGSFRWRMAPLTTDK